MKKFLIFFILLALTGLIFGQTKVGTTAANFLTIPVGPRATGMGGAFVAVGDDATSAFWNSGGLSRAVRNELTFVHTDWLVNTDLNWLGFVVEFSCLF